MQKELSISEKADIVLFQLNHWRDHDNLLDAHINSLDLFSLVYCSYGEQISTGEFLGILMTLKERKMLLIEGKEKNYFFATFEGMLWEESGGFTGEIARNAAENIRLRNLENAQSENDKRTLNLTRILATFSAVMALFELIKMFVDKDEDYAIHSMTIVTTALIFVLGAATGLFLYLSLSSANRNIKNKG